MEWSDEDEKAWQEEKVANDAYCAEVQKAREEYIAKWPNYCRECGGWGFYQWREEYGELISEECAFCLETIA